MSEQMRLGEFAPSPAKVSFLEGLLATWVETTTRKSPTKKERKVLHAVAEQAVIGYQAVILAREEE